MKQFVPLSAFIVFITFFSCNGDDSPNQVQVNTSFLSKSENKGLRNQEISFFDMFGAIDNTTIATFYVNDEPIEGNKFSSSTAGMFKVYSQYNVDGMTTISQVDSFEVYIPRKKALIEGFTGTWCGNCPYL